MQCNIDARGRVVRLRSGILVAFVGGLLLTLAAFGALDGWWVWVVGASALALGAFQIFEARAGWCVLRALGFRTPV